jgi:uncharacterized membrane protein YbhN (UPF0104 family)
VPAGREQATDPPPASVGRRKAVLLVILLVSITGYLVLGSDTAGSLQRLSPTVLAVGLLCQLLAQLSWNGAMLLPLRTSLRRLGYWELFTVRSGGILAGFVVPLAGSLGVRLAYLRRRGLTYPEFVWATLISNLLALSTSASLAVCAVAGLWLFTGQSSAPVLWLTGCVLMLGVTAGVTVRWLPQVAAHPALRRLTWLSGMSSRRASRDTVFAVSMLSLGRHVFSFLTFGLLYQSLSPLPNHLLSGGLVYAITSPVRLVAITPGNFGVTEWVVAAVGRLLMFDLTTGLLVGLVFRGMSLAAHGLGMLIAGAWFAWGPSITRAQETGIT